MPKVLKLPHRVLAKGVTLSKVSEPRPHLQLVAQVNDAVIVIRHFPKASFDEPRPAA